MDSRVFLAFFPFNATLRGTVVELQGNLVKRFRIQRALKQRIKNEEIVYQGYSVDDIFRNGVEA